MTVSIILQIRTERGNNRTMDEQNGNQRVDKPERSTFVTVVAWIFIIFSGFGVVIGALQNIALWFLFPRAEVTRALEQANENGEISEFHSLLFGSFELLFLVLFLIVVAVLFTSIGLLRRRNWARITFIGLMALGMMWNVGGLAFMYLFVDPMMPPAMEGVPPEFAAMQNLVVWTNLLLALVFLILFGWIIKKLMSPAIKREFV